MRDLVVLPVSAGTSIRRCARRIACLIVLAGLGVSANPSFAQEPSFSRLALFERYLETLRQRVRIPGLSGAIVHHQRIIWEKGFGYQDLERRIAARPDTPYRIASLTKTFTSMLLMRCVDQGTVDLDSPIRRYTNLIPEPGATVGHVLSHTSAGTPGTSGITATATLR